MCGLVVFVMMFVKSAVKFFFTYITRRLRCLNVVVGHPGIGVRVKGPTETTTETLQQADTGSRHIYTGN